MGYSQNLYTIKVIRDKQTGLSLKYGFLEFDSHRNAEKFMVEQNGKPFPNMPHKFLKIKWASYGGGVKPVNIAASTVPGVNIAIIQEISIYVGDLDASITEAKLL